MHVWHLGDPDANGAAVYLSFFLLYIGWALIEGRKIPAIYLRRFGSTSANRVITNAIKARLGSAYRVVTLDDFAIRPTYPPRVQVLLSVLAPLVIAVLLIGIDAYLYELQSRQAHGFLSGLGESFGPLIITWLFGMCGIMALLHLWRVFKRSRMQAVDIRGVHKIIRRVLKLSNWLRGPRVMDSAVTVVRVADSEWKSMVSSLLKYTENVIIDVSIPTSNLLWELEQISRLDFRQCVIVANRDLLLRWLNMTQHPNETCDLYDKTRALLVDQEILLYDPEIHTHTRAWQDNLRRALDNVMEPPRYTAERRRAYFKPRMTSVLSTVLFYGLVVILWLNILGWIVPLLEPIRHFAKSLAGGAMQQPRYVGPHLSPIWLKPAIAQPTISESPMAYTAQQPQSQAQDFIVIAKDGPDGLILWVQERDSRRLLLNTVTNGIALNGDLNTGRTAALTVTSQGSGPNMPIASGAFMIVRDAFSNGVYEASVHRAPPAEIETLAPEEQARFEAWERQFQPTPCVRDPSLPMDTVRLEPGAESKIRPGYFFPIWPAKPPNYVPTQYVPAKVLRNDGAFLGWQYFSPAQVKRLHEQPNAINRRG